MLDYSVYFLEEELTFIRSQAIKGEKQGRFSKEILNLIHKKEWLRVAMPTYKNTKPLDAYQIALLFEALAYADGSLGWAINLGAGANMFLGYLKESTANELSENKKLWFAGSGACTGKAIKAEGGYKVSGHWKYASGSLYASHFTANAYLYDADGESIVDKNNNPVFKSFLFPTKSVEVINSWHTTGLRASCSNDYKVLDCFVPNEHSFDLTKQSIYAKSPLYRYPFDAFAATNIAVMCTGMAQHFIDLFERDIASKTPLYGEISVGEEPQVKLIFNKVTQDFYNARKVFLADIKNLWQAVNDNSNNQSILEAILQKSAREAANQSYDLVMGLYRYCGMNAVYNSNELSKVIRDFLVATQHFAISPLQTPLIK